MECTKVFTKYDRVPERIERLRAYQIVKGLEGVLFVSYSDSKTNKLFTVTRKDYNG